MTIGHRENSYHDCPKLPYPGTPTRPTLESPASLRILVQNPVLNAPLIVEEYLACDPAPHFGSRRRTKTWGPLLPSAVSPVTGARGSGVSARHAQVCTALGEPARIPANLPPLYCPRERCWAHGRFATSMYIPWTRSVQAEVAQWACGVRDAPSGAVPRTWSASGSSAAWPGSQSVAPPQAPRWRDPRWPSRPAPTSAGPGVWHPPAQAQAMSCGACSCPRTTRPAKLVEPGTCARRALSGASSLESKK